MQAIPTGAVDMILTDLPYGMTACIWDTILPFDQLWRQFERVIKPNGAIVLTACQPFTTQLIASNIKHFKYCWYWHKNIATGFCFSKYQPMRCVEDIAVFYRKMPTYHPQGLIPLETPQTIVKKRFKKDSIYRMQDLHKEYTTNFCNYPKNLLEVKTQRGLHPTQKPVELFEYLVRTYSDPDDLVLDCCMGSGTTAVACIRSGRNYSGFELSREYFNQLQSRITKEAAQYGAAQPAFYE